MIPLVIIPHVSWRRQALIDLLEQLAKQTMKSAVIVLADPLLTDPNDSVNWPLAQRHEDSNVFVHRPSWWPKEVGGGVSWSTGQAAQCERWQYVEQIDEFGSTAPILTLDDDMIIDEKYVERTVIWLNELVRNFEGPCVLSWGGLTTNYTFKHYYDDHPACELLVPQAGAMAFHASTFDGMIETEVAKRSLVRGGCEELPISYFAHTRGIPIFRPKGYGPTPHRCAFDARSSSRTTQGKLNELLLWTEENKPRYPHAKPWRQVLAGCMPAPYRRRS